MLKLGPRRVSNAAIMATCLACIRGNQGPSSADTNETQRQEGGKSTRAAQHPSIEALVTLLHDARIVLDYSLLIRRQQAAQTSQWWQSEHLSCDNPPYVVMSVKCYCLLLLLPVTCYCLLLLLPVTYYCLLLPVTVTACYCNCLLLLLLPIS